MGLSFCPGKRCHNDGGSRGRDAKRPDGKNVAQREWAGLEDKRLEPMMIHQEGPAVTQSHDRKQSWLEGRREGRGLHGGWDLLMDCMGLGHRGVPEGAEMWS